jgi:tripartite-type tricarboxylate transporter receptor subunit TctC
MSVSRRVICAAALATPMLSACGRSQAAGGVFPAKDITFIIPVAAGGGLDVYARLIGASMEESLPRRVNVVPFNVPSGGGGKGVTQLFRAQPDGYTIGILNIPGIFVLQRVRRIPHDFGAFTWLGALTLGENYGVAVRGSSPIQTLDDLRALSRRRPITLAATGPEGTGYTATVIGARMLGLRSRVVTGYKNSTDYAVGALRGDTDAVISTLTVIKRLNGALRIIATFEMEGSIPGVPDATDLGAPELSNLMGMRAIAAPPGLPPDIAAILADALSKAAHNERVVRWARGNGEIIQPQTPEQTRAIGAARRAFLERFRGLTSA